jgi:hypothetical protein
MVDGVSEDRVSLVRGVGRRCVGRGAGGGVGGRTYTRTGIYFGHAHLLTRVLTSGTLMHTHVQQT